MARLNSPASLGAPSTGVDRAVIAFGPWAHVALIGRIGSRKYAIDASFGPFECPSPVPLVHDEPFTDEWSVQCRVVLEPIPGYSDTEQKWWRVQSRDSADHPWMVVYCFTETEWLPVDFHMTFTALRRAAGAGSKAG
ncbi:hypothetical protein BJY01DRAFT_256000 [Aspergillus pseudoustus]|uniref:Uncharacterized protein n=1 Tax=Aspergillus pseudoustus TaxID=1810923 RepID=A0ABR4IF64_9EURO